MIAHDSSLIQVTTSAGWGGRESLPLAIHRRWLDEGVNATLLVGRDTELARRSAGIASTVSVPRGRLSLAMALRHLISTGRPAVILSHFTHDLPSISLALTGHRHRRLVVIKHVSPGPAKRDWFHRAMYRRVDRLLCVSEFVRRKCIATYPISDDRILVWYPGVDVGRFEFDPAAREKIRRTTGVGEREYVVGYVARITPNKGLENLIDAAKLVLIEAPGTRLWLIGGSSKEEQEYETQLRRRVTELDLGEHVCFWGQQEGVAEYLSAMDLFVTPASNESFGLTTVEAMAAARPVVGFRAAGTAEIVVDGMTGVLADLSPDPSLALAQAILSVRRDPVRAAAMGSAGRERAMTIFSHEAMMIRLEDLIGIGRP